MRAKPHKVTFKPLILLIGLAISVLELSAYLSYQKHLPDLISDIFQFDYQQKIGVSFQNPYIKKHSKTP